MVQPLVAARPRRLRGGGATRERSGIERGKEKKCQTGATIKLADDRQSRPLNPCRLVRQVKQIEQRKRPQPCFQTPVGSADR